MGTKREDKEYNKIMNQLALSCHSFEEFKEKLQEYREVAALPPKADTDLKKFYNRFSKEYNDLEHGICDAAKKLVKTNDGVTVSPEQKSRLGINDIGENIAKGPHLTILDGGPGAGKSFSLGKSMAATKAPVVCLGATESAAAGLFGDMQKVSEEIGKRKSTGKNIDVLGGLTVDQFLKPRSPEEKAKRKEIDDLLRSHPDPKPVFMVDEAGLLDHKAIKSMLDYANKMGLKMILAGDSQQIPPEKGQPFNMLVESLKDTPAYVNAPYVFRQGNFIDKAITSGIYHGNDSTKMAISEEMAAEFMTAAYDVGDPKFSDRTHNKNGEEKKFSFKDYMKEKYGNVDKAEAVGMYVKELSGKAEEFFGNDMEKMLTALKEGPSAKIDENGNSQYDKYVCAALMCQAMGVRSYDLRGKMNASDNVIDSVARDFADDYTLSLLIGQEKREKAEAKKAQEEGRMPEPVDQKYEDGKLAITATKEEADELNAAIRKAMGKPEKLTEGEPIILADGSRVLASKEQAANPPEGFGYAYALDVTTTQGMSQVGKVTMVVTKETQNKWESGEILVGASRHKGDFEILTTPDVDKEKLFASSSQQQAPLRTKGKAFVEDVYLSAGGNHDLLAEKRKDAKEDRKEAKEVQIEKALLAARISAAKAKS